MRDLDKKALEGLALSFFSTQPPAPAEPDNFRLLNNIPDSLLPWPDLDDLDLAGHPLCAGSETDAGPGLLSGFYTAKEGISVPSLASTRNLRPVNVTFYETGQKREAGCLALGMLDRKSVFPLVGALITENGPMSLDDLEALDIRPVPDKSTRPLNAEMFVQSLRSIIDPSSFQLLVPLIDGRPRLDLLHEPGGMLPELPPDKDTRIVAVPFCSRQYKGGGCHNYKGHHARKDQITEWHAALCSDSKSPWVRVVDQRFSGEAGILISVVFQFGQDPVGGQSSVERVVFSRQQRVLEKAFELALPHCRTDEEIQDIFKVLSNILLRITPIADRNMLPGLSSRDLCVAEYAVRNDTRRLSYFCNKECDREDRIKDYREFVLEKYSGEAPSFFVCCRERHLSSFFLNLSLTVRSVLEAGFTNPRDQNLCGNVDVEGGIADLSDLAEMEDPHQAIGLFHPLVNDLCELGEVAGFPQGLIFKTPFFREFLRSLFHDRADRILSFIDAAYFMDQSTDQTRVMRINKVACLMTDAWAESQGAPPRGGYYMTDGELREKTRLMKNRLDFSNPHEVDFIRSILDRRYWEVPSVSENSETIRKNLEEITA